MSVTIDLRIFKDDTTCVLENSPGHGKTLSVIISKAYS